MQLFPSTDWTKHPLHVAAMSGNVAEVERLLAAGADPNENVSLKGTPLHLAVRSCQGGFFRVGRGHVEIVRLLLASGSDVNTPRLFSGTPLHDAAAAGDAVLAGILLENGAVVNSQLEDHRRTPLHLAVAACKSHMVEFLLSKGADVNAIADFVPNPSSPRYYEHCGMTPLHAAAKEGYFQIVEQLLAAGANSALRVAQGSTGCKGYTALDLALLHRLQLEDRIQIADETVKRLNGGVPFDPSRQSTLAQRRSFPEMEPLQ